MPRRESPGPLSRTTSPTPAAAPSGGSTTSERIPRTNCPTFGQWFGAILSQENHRQIYVPKGFAHGFCVLSETANVLYKCTGLYTPGDEYGILWSDPAIGIEWPGETPILSEKDLVHPLLADVPEADLFTYSS